MVAEAVRRGYAYYAICDHSHRLRDGRLEQQAEAIDALDELVPVQLLKGIEVNIRVERRGSTSPTTSSRRSTGSSLRCTTPSTADPTGRVLAAMENPYVDCIGHLTGRKIGRREPPRRSTSSA